MTVGLEAFPFHLHLEVVGLVVALAASYAYALVRLGPKHAFPGDPPATRWQVASFTTGLLLLASVESWPIHDIAEGSLFSFHMVEHLMLALLVPPALLLGTPWWLARLLLRPVLPILRVLTQPVVALVLFNAVIALFHAPGVVRLQLTNEAAHLGLHLLLMATATLMWWPVIGPIPDIPRLSPFMAMGYLFLQSLVPTIPASFLTFADEPVYRVYETLPRLWGLDVVTDQMIAGLIMKIGGGIILWTGIGIIFFRWAARESGAVQRRPDRVRPARSGRPTRNTAVSPSDSDTTGAAKSSSSSSRCSPMRAPGV